MTDSKGPAHASAPPAKARAPAARVTTPAPAAPAVAPGAGWLQLSVRVSEPGDELEREADSVATNVVARRAARPHISRAPRPTIHRSCAACSNGGSSCCDRKIDRSARDASPRHTAALTTPARGPPAAADQALAVVSGGGSPIPMHHRAGLEQAFGADFGAVRLHTDARAAQANDALEADAFTFGSHIAFADGRFAPDSPGGLHLLAHELTHVVQQGGSDAQSRAPPATIQRAPESDDDTWSLSNLRKGVGKAVHTVVDTTTAVAGDVANVAGDAAGTAADIAGAAADVVTAPIAAAAESVTSLIERYAPGVLEWIHGDVIAPLKSMLGHAVDGVFAGLAGIGCGGKEIAEVVPAEGGPLPGANQCGEFAGAVGSALSWLSRLNGFPLLKCARGLMGVAGSVLGHVWDFFIGDDLRAIRESGALQWVTEHVAWLWDKTAELRKWVSLTLLAPVFPFPLLSELGVTDWLVAKAKIAWDWLKQQLAPWMPQIQAAGKLALVASGFGPALLAVDLAPAAWSALEWLVDNWTSGEIVVVARDALEKRVIPSVLGGVRVITQGIATGAAWVGDKLNAVAGAVSALAEGAAGIPLLGVAAQEISHLAGQAHELADLLRFELDEIVAAVKTKLDTVAKFLVDVLEIVREVSMTAANPLAIPLMLAGRVWLALPLCLKAPIIDFVLSLLSGLFAHGPPIEFIAEFWEPLAEQALPWIEETKKLSVEERIARADNVARSLAKDGGVQGLANLVQAAVHSPEQFTGQLLKELGLDLTRPLPFEVGAVTEGSPRTAFAGANPVAANVGGNGALAARILGGQRLTDNDVAINEVATLILTDELIDAIDAGGSRPFKFGRRDGPNVGLDAVRGALVRPAGTASPTTATPAAATNVDEQLSAMARAALDMPCGKDEQPPEGRAPPMPDDQRIGPLTQLQRATFLLESMSAGAEHWWDCNKGWLIPAIALALIAVILLVIFSGGTVAAVLPEILEVLGTVMLGYSVLRATGYLGIYVVQALSGDLALASESLARAAAIVAIELLFMLIAGGENPAALEKGAVEEAEQGGRTLAKAGSETAEVVGKGGRDAMELGEAALQDGKLMLRGPGSEVGEGVKSVEGFAEQMERNTLFRSLEVETEEGARIKCTACINGCVVAGRQPEASALEKDALALAISDGRVSATGKITHLNGAMAEEIGIRTRVLEELEHPIQLPGKVTARGPDYITFNEEGLGTIFVDDAKYRSDGVFPKGFKPGQLEAWTPEIKKAAREAADKLRVSNPKLSQKILDAIDRPGGIKARIFPWPPK